jgi:hypothetical protein
MKLLRIFSRSIRVSVLAAITASAGALNYDVNFTATPPAIDGTIDAVWATASPAATGFVDATAAVTVSDQQTHVRVLWDSNKLYVLYEADDSLILPGATANDTGFSAASDAAEIYLDPSFWNGTAGNDYIYQIAVDPSPSVFTYTAAGYNQPSWNLGAGTQIAYAANGTNWLVEMAIPWTELNSSTTNSPGFVVSAPGNNSIWGAQFGRRHAGDPANNLASSKWQPTVATTTNFRGRPFGTLTFRGGPAAGRFDLSSDPEAELLYGTSFEAPTYVADETVSGTEVWTTLYASTFITTSAQALTGSQSLQIQPVSGQTLSAAAPLTGNSKVSYIDYALKMPPETGTGYRHVLYVQGKYTTGTIALGQIWFMGRLTTSPGANLIQINSYENPATETATASKFAGIQTFNEWSYLTVRVLEQELKFEVWYNGVKLARPGTEGKYGLRLPHIFERTAFGHLYTKNYGTQPVFVDDYAHLIVPGPTAARDWSLYE